MQNQNQNLIQNPTFSLHASTYCKLDYCDSNNSPFTGLNGQDPSIAIAPWKITSGGHQLELDSNKRWPGYGDSKWSIDLNVNNKPYTIGQTVSTVSGSTYSISYFIKENTVCRPSPKTGFIRATNGRNSTFTVSGGVWQEHSYNFKATSNKVTVEIGS